MLFRMIASQYVLETLLFLCLACLTLLPTMKRREPRNVLAVLTGLNILRFGGVAGSLAALGRSSTPAFLAQVALGDGLAASLALLAFVLLRRRSAHAAVAVAWMNIVGLLGIVVSETWLTWLELAGHSTRASALHGPTVGASLYTALHVLAFYVLALGARPVRDASFAAE